MRLVAALDWARSGGAVSRPRIRAAGAIAAAATLVLVAGCRVPGTSSSAAGPTGSGTITVAAAATIGDAPLYMAIKSGLFSKQGLTVRVLPEKSFGAELTDLASGRAQVAFGDYADIFYSEQKKPPKLSIIANGYDAGANVMEVLALPGKTPNSGIVSPAQLAGKVIGTPEPQEIPATSASGAPDSLETAATWSVLSADNVRPSRITWKAMPTPALVSALQNHRVDAILATEPTIFQAETLGAVPVLDAGTGTTAALPLDGYFSTAQYAAKSSTNLSAFRFALNKAQAEASQPAPVQATLISADNLPAETASLVNLGTYPTAVQPADLQRVANLMFEFGMLPTTNPISVAPMIFKGT